MVVPILPCYAVRHGASAFLVGLLVSAFSIAQLVSAPAWGRLSDRVGRRPTLLAGLVVSSLAPRSTFRSDCKWPLCHLASLPSYGGDSRHAGRLLSQE
jgi:MFS family permease